MSRKPFNHRHSNPSERGNRLNAPNVQGTAFKKIHLAALPTIGLTDGPNIPHIRDALQHYSQREFGDISNIFVEGAYKAPVAARSPQPDFESDPSGILKQLTIARLKREDADYDVYLKNKAKLFSVISSMTTRDLDERILAHQESLTNTEINEMIGGAEINETSILGTAVATTELTDTATSTATATDLPSAPISTTQCPLFLWKCIVFVTTTTKIGNLREDQNNILIKYVTVKQRSGESISEYKRRIINILDSYTALRLDRPTDIDIASRFLFGLDDDRYESLKTYLANEAANGRDLYPVSLDGAATQATKCVVAWST
jgi:hypothetical protein